MLNRTQHRITTLHHSFKFSTSRFLYFWPYRVAEGGYVRILSAYLYMIVVYTMECVWRIFCARSGYVYTIIEINDRCARAILFRCVNYTATHHLGQPSVPPRRGTSTLCPQHTRVRSLRIRPERPSRPSKSHVEHNLLFYLCLSLFSLINLTLCPMNM